MAITVKEEATTVKEEATMAWCSNCLNISQIQWEGDSQCCLDCGKILAQILLGKFIREGKRRRVLSRTWGRRLRRRRSVAIAVREQQIVSSLSEADSS